MSVVAGLQLKPLLNDTRFRWCVRLNVDIPVEEAAAQRQREELEKHLNALGNK